MRLTPHHERWLYVLGATVLLSGLSWLVSHYFLAGNNLGEAFNFDGMPNESEPWWLKLHGLSVLGFLVAFGALLPGHVAHGWRRRLNRWTGALMVAVVAALGLSGYALYYLIDESTRPWISATHWLLGLIAIAALIIHIVSGKRAARQRKAQVTALRTRKHADRH